MINILLGSICSLVCACVFFCSWILKRKSAYVLSILLLLLGGAILRSFVSSDQYLHKWDERFHALVSKNLIEDPIKPMLYKHPVLPYDYKHWNRNHVWVHKQPVPLWAMACSLKIFGISEFALRIPSILLSTMAILLTYLIGFHLYGRNIGWMAAFLHAIHGKLIELTGGRVATDHFDLFFMFFIELAIYLAIISLKKDKNWLLWILIGVSTGLAILSKWLPALIVFPVWLMLKLHKKIKLSKSITPLSVSLFVAFLTMLPWQIYTHSRFPLEAAWESHYNFLHFTEVLSERSGSFFFHFDKLRINYGELVYLPLIWLFYYGIKKKDLKIAALIIWIFVPVLFFSFAKTKMQGYTIFVAPAVFITISLFWRHLNIIKRRTKYIWLTNTILALLILLPIRYSVERIKPFSDKERSPQWTQDLKKLSSQISNENAVIFNVKNPIDAMFYGNFTAYPSIPENEKLIELKKQGYDLYILNSDDLNMKNFENLQGIQILDLN